VSKVIESANAHRPVPIVSFVARQRDLRELVGTSVPGSDKLGFADTLKYWEGRFASVKLSDTNRRSSPAVGVLVPRSPQARAEIDTALYPFTQLDGLQEAVRATLLTSHADRAAFRRTYPFSPAFMETLVALSGAHSASARRCGCCSGSWSPNATPWSWASWCRCPTCSMRSSPATSR
jgi:hypothetical protein